MVDITVTKKMWSVSVSQLRCYVLLWWTDIIVYSTGQTLFVMDLGVKNNFDAICICLGACWRMAG